MRKRSEAVGAKVTKDLVGAIERGEVRPPPEVFPGTRVPDPPETYFVCRACSNVSHHALADWPLTEPCPKCSVSGQHMHAVTGSYCGHEDRNSGLLCGRPQFALVPTGVTCPGGHPHAPQLSQGEVITRNAEARATRTHRHADAKVVNNVVNASVSRTLPRVNATVGERLFTPVQYHAFRVGPFSVSLDVEPGEDPDEVQHRAYAQARRMYEEAFEQELREYVEKMKRVAELVRG